MWSTQNTPPFQSWLRSMFFPSFFSSFRNQNNYGTYSMMLVVSFISRQPWGQWRWWEETTEVWPLNLISLPRLARNRESARQSRRRKKQYQELLDDKVCCWIMNERSNLDQRCCQRVDPSPPEAPPKVPRLSAAADPPLYRCFEECMRLAFSSIA